MPLCLCAFVPLVGALLSAAPSLHAAMPDQVLVLYNEDWTEDLDGSEPGQDSLEVARYYVEQHTDPVSGRKPYLLGLTCKHPGKKHLNLPRLPEDGNDNFFGIEYAGPGQGPKLDDRTKPVYLVGKVEVVLRDADARKIDWDSVVFKMSETGDEAAATVVWQNGKAQSDAIRSEPDEPKGKANLSGQRFSIKSEKPFWLWYSAKDTTGKIVAEHKALRLWRASDFRPSRTGADGVLDDLNYVTDIEEPVKRFLLDPDKALPDGTLLKDHILYIVACYGLPRCVESAYGILRGITDSLSNYGDGSSLDQRLMGLFFDFERLRIQGRSIMDIGPMPLVPDAQGFQGSILVSNMRIRASAPLNPYKHPKSYRPQDYGRHSEQAERDHYADRKAVWEPIYPPGELPHPHFTPAWRRTQHPVVFIYSASRIDADHPSDARRLIDNAVYATKHFTAGLGEAAFRRGGPQPCGASSQFAVDELKVLGFKLPADYRGSPDHVPRANMFFGLSRSAPDYLEDGPVVGDHGFYPGAVASVIKSGNGWRSDATQFEEYFPRQIDCGVTVTGGYGGQGHIHSASWWDDKIMFHHLFGGYDLGECFLMSGAGLIDWVQTYVGDPLYRPDLSKTTPDTQPPNVRDKADIAAKVAPADGVCYALVTCRLDASPQQPEMVEVLAEYWREGQPRSAVRDWFFTARPRIALRELAPDSTYLYRLVLTDPYGNAFDSEKAFGPLMIKTPAAPAAKPLLDLECVRQPGLRTVANLAPTRVSGRIEGRDITDVAGEGCLKLGGSVSVTVHTGVGTVATDDDILPGDQGQARIVFALSEAARGTMLFDTPGMSLGIRPWQGAKHAGQLRFSIGGGTVLSHEPLDFEYGRKYDVTLRWRREPLTREIYLRNKEGREVLVGANNIYPWRPQQPGDKLRIGSTPGQYYRFQILDDARPSSDAASEVYPRRLDLKALGIE